MQANQENSASLTYTLTHKSRVEQFKTFLESHDKETPIALLYDDDADGMSAGTIMRHTLIKLGFTKITCSPKSRERETFSTNFLQNLESMGIETIICVDFEPISWRMSTPKKVNDLPFDIIIIDHHFDESKTYDEFTTEKTRLFIHPLNSSNTENPSQYCCAKFVYDVCEQITDIKDIAWKQLSGIIGDMNIIKWPEFTRELAKENGHEIGPGKQDFFLSPYGVFATVYGFAASLSADEAEEVFDAYFKAEKIEDMQVFNQKYNVMWTEYNRIFTDWKKDAEYDEEHNLYFVEIKSKYLLTSILSSVISYVHDEYAFFFYQHNTEHSYHISMRSQFGTVHLGELLKHVSKKFENSNGGGHIPAAGGFCNESDITDFKKRVRECYNKFQIKNENKKE